MSNTKGKLRLLMFEECNRKCAGCCNNDFDLEALLVASDFTGYSEIMLTGGEPLLKPELVLGTIRNIREQTNTPIYLYTAMASRVMEVIHAVQGVTLTLHDEHDMVPFIKLTRDLELVDNLQWKSLRLNVFKEAGYIEPTTGQWLVANGIEWIKDCPLPQNETFMRLI